MLVATLTALQTANTGYDLRQVLAIDLPAIFAPGVNDPSRDSVLLGATRRIGALPGVERVAMGGNVPWRDRGSQRVQFVAEGISGPTAKTIRPAGCDMYRRSIFGVLGVPILSGRDFKDDDRTSQERVAIVNQSVAQRLFPNGDALNRRLMPSNLGTNLGNPQPGRIVGIVADVDEDDIVQEPTMIVYYPLRGAGGRLFVRAVADPRALIPSVTRTIRDLSADQAVERPATLEDIRADVLAPERLNAFVFSALGGIALLIALVGVAGVLAFSVSARTREFGVRLAVGSTPGALRTGVLWDGVRTAVIGIAVGAIGGYALARIVARFFEQVQVPGVLPVIAAAVALIIAAVAASLMPAMRASRVDVLQALRSE